MLAKVCSAAVNGIEAYPVEVEVNSGWGDTVIVVVGLPDTAVKESKDRVITALGNSGFKFPMGRTTINLAPADVKKEGPSFDLPIAVGMLAAGEQMQSADLEKYILTGELALTGAIRPVKGVLPIALRARGEKKRGVLVPVENAAEAAVVTGLEVIPVQNLREAIGFLEGEIQIAPMSLDVKRLFQERLDDDLDFADDFPSGGVDDISVAIHVDCRDESDAGWQDARGIAVLAETDPELFGTNLRAVTGSDRSARRGARGQVP